MRPRVILSNAVSPNGSLTGYDVDYGVYYPVLLSYRPDAVLVGADTILAAPVEIPPEQDVDRIKRPVIPGETRPWLVAVDSKGRLSSVLHFYRRMEYTRDVIVLVSEKTPSRYIRFLEDRDYEYLITGKEHVDLQSALDMLSRGYAIRTLVSDTGGTLDTALLSAGLVDEISLVVAPVLSARTDILLFKPDPGSGKNIPLSLKECGDIGEGYVHLVYEVTE
ncbi:MAG: 5-amino-6-(5-phosphoribosylamino)uracil reductase [Methanomicrobiales archaeon]|nr:5-amino-6-(5-phosphoribosylamino)uracil reductase [Methanomicrobiales archaeon]